MKSNMISLINDDLFSAHSDVFVVPRSTIGTMTNAFKNGLKNMNVDINSPLEYRSLGSIDSMSINQLNPIRDFIIIYATSVEGTSSNLNAISEIALQISRVTINNPKIRSVAIPLLGTGAGGLNHIDVYKTYLEKFTAHGSPTCHFSVYIPEESIYERVRKYQENTSLDESASDLYNADVDISTIEANPYSFFPVTRFIFRDKNNVEPVLGVRELAQKTSEIIKKIAGPEQGNMIGIFGRWGRGKSFFINTLWNELSINSNHKKVEFHAWKYQDSPASWAYLYERFSEAYFNDAKNWAHKIRRRFFLNWIRLDVWKLIYFSLVVAISVIFSFFIPFSDKLNWVRSFTIWIGGIIVLLKIIYFYYKYGGTAKNLFKEYYNKISFSKYLGTQAEVQRELIFLLRACCTKKNKNRIFLFVEDIDRCPEQKVMDIVDSLRVMLEDNIICDKVIIIAAIDERILHNAIKMKYNSILGENSTGISDELINEYFDKLFMLGLKLGDLSASERDEYFVQLTKDDRQQFEVIKYKSHSRHVEVKQNVVTEESEKRFKEDNLIQTPPLLIERSTKDHKATTQSNNNNIDVDKIIPEEFEMLRKILRQNLQMTPRQIRIFYYRYILVKHILEIEYLRSQLQSSLLEADKCETMANLLIEYSKPGGRSKLTDQKIQALTSTSLTMKVEMLADKTMKTEDYCQLLRILDIVVAY